MSGIGASLWSILISTSVIEPGFAQSAGTQDAETRGAGHNVAVTRDAGTEGADKKGITAQAAQSEFDAIEKRIRESTATEKDMQYLTEIVGKQSNNARANLLLAQYMELKGFEQLAIDALDRAIRSDPNYGLAHYQRCQLLLRMYEVDEAMKSIDACAKHMANDGERLFQLGLALDRVGQNERAKQFFKAAAKAGRQGQGYGANLAQLRMMHNKYEEALEAVAWDLRLNPSDARANLVKAEILDHQGKRDQAVACLLTAARGNPCDQLAANVATSRLIEFKRYKEALNTAILDLLCQRHEPRDMDKVKQVVFELLQKIPDKESQPIVMSTATQIEKSRRCRYVRLALGDVYDRLRKPSRAVEQYQLGLHSCPAQLSDSLTQARGMYRLGRDYEIHYRNYREALDLYRRAAALAPGDREIVSQYERLNRRMKNRPNDIAWRIKDAWYAFWQSLWPTPPL